MDIYIYMYMYFWAGGSVEAKDLKRNIGIHPHSRAVSCMLFPCSSFWILLPSTVFRLRKAINGDAALPKVKFDQNLGSDGVNLCAWYSVGMKDRSAWVFIFFSRC